MRHFRRRECSLAALSVLLAIYNVVLLLLCLGHKNCLKSLAGNSHQGRKETSRDKCREELVKPNPAC